MASDFENAISNIAFSYMQEKHKNILKHIVAFQMIDYDEKEARGEGFFLANIGGKYFQIPVFFINGELKEIVHLYDKQNDKMYYLSDEQINSFLSRKPNAIGHGVKNLPEMSERPIDFRNLTAPVSTTKYANFKPQHTFKDFIKESNNLVKRAFLDILERDKDILEFFVNRYGKEIIKSAALINSNNRQNDLYIIKDLEKASSLDAIDKLKFMKNGYVIKDRRERETLTPIVQNVVRKRTPDKDGIYQIPTTEGVENCIVAVNPFIINGDKRLDKILFINMKSKNYGYCDPHHIVADHNDIDLKDSIEEIPSKPIKQMKAGKRYVLYDHIQAEESKTGSFSIPFTVSQKFIDSEGNPCFRIDPDMFPSRTIFLRQRQAISEIDDHLYVPDNSMVVEVERNIVYPMSKELVENEFIGGYDYIKCANLDISINNKLVKRCSKRSDMVYDVAKAFNINVDKLEHLVDDKQGFYVKKAAPFIDNNSRYSLAEVPEHSEIDTRYEEEYTLPNTTLGEKVQYPEFFSEDQVRSDIKNLIDLSKIEGLDVVDPGMMGVMSKLQDPGPMIKKFLPNITKCVDALGKILYMLWSKGYKVKDEFGISEFSEFEEKLKDTFANLSDIALQVKSKTFVQDEVL